MAETATPTAAPEPTTEQQIESLFKDTPDEAAIEVTAEPAAAEAPKETPPAAPEVSEIEEKLKEIPDAPEVKEEAKPALSPDQQQILAHFPTPEVAKQVVTESGYFQTLNTALQNQDFDTVEQMFAPEALDGFREHLYKKHAVEFVDRWISENDGTAPVVKGMSAMESRLMAKIAQLEAKQSERESSAQRETQAQEQARLQKSYNDHLTSVFDKFSFSPADRRYVAADITSKVSSDPALLAAYRSGNVMALNKAIKESIRDYSVKDQAAQVKKEETIATQMTKKPLVSGQAVVTTGALPDDINQVPKDQRENWMTQQLNKLMR